MIADPAETVWTTLELSTGKAGLRLARKPQEAGRRRVDHYYWWVGGGCNDNTTLSFLHGRRDRERGNCQMSLDGRTDITVRGQASQPTKTNIRQSGFPSGWGEEDGGRRRRG